MMKILYGLVLSTCLLMSFGVNADSFDCITPPFGADISGFDGFVKYRDEGDISYFNYTGSDRCELPVHTFASPWISYAVVDSKL